MGWLVSLFGGPLAGLLGSIVSGAIGYFERKQQIAADKARFAHEEKLQTMNIEARGRELEQEDLIAQTRAIADTLAASYQHDASYGPVSKGAAAGLRWVRPGLTIFLLVLVAALWFTAPDGAITIGDETMTIKERIVSSILFMAEAAMTWWFADRRRANK
ncbi:MAG: hypothetical protein RBS99_19455 [Rhodospirillales bacterium]|jgi:hypothetical protein|nr:hypothetical protein [Rhodospirillales bacterium]